jgi:hypothetical protein
MLALRADLTTLIFTAGGEQLTSSMVGPACMASCGGWSYKHGHKLPGLLRTVLGGGNPSLTANRTQSGGQDQRLEAHGGT